MRSRSRSRKSGGQQHLNVGAIMAMNVKRRRLGMREIPLTAKLKVGSTATNTIY